MCPKCAPISVALLNKRPSNNEMRDITHQNVSTLGNLKLSDYNRYYYIYIHLVPRCFNIIQLSAALKSDSTHNT